jgi:RNA polymerase sigma-70 factor (ECF subfamily)
MLRGQHVSGPASSEQPLDAISPGEEVPRLEHGKERRRTNVDERLAGRDQEGPASVDRFGGLGYEHATGDALRKVRCATSPLRLRKGPLDEKDDRLFVQARHPCYYTPDRMAVTNQPASLTRAFLTSHTGALSAADEEKLAAELDLVLVALRAAWPALHVDAVQFAERLGQAAEGKPGALPRVHAADLYLASGCADGDPASLRAFEGLLARDVPMFVAHISRDDVFVDELLQNLRERLLIGAERERPRISTYRGTGPLGGWLRVAAVRAALDMQKKLNGGRQGRPESVAAFAPDVELLHVKAKYEAQFKVAVEAGLFALDSQDRTMLKLRHIDGLTVERIGTMFGVHASTVVRRLAAATDQVNGHVRRTLRDELKLSAADIESLAALVESQIDLSLSRILEA